MGLHSDQYHQDTDPHNTTLTSLINTVHVPVLPPMSLARVSSFRRITPRRHHGLQESTRELVGSNERTRRARIGAVAITARRPVGRQEGAKKILAMAIRYLVLCTLLESTLANHHIGPGFSCKYGNKPEACLQNKDGYPCCTNVANRPAHFYCKDGLTGPPGGSGNLDCGREIWWVPTGVTYMCCNNPPKLIDDQYLYVIIAVGATVGVMLLIVCAVCCWCRAARRSSITPSSITPGPPAHSVGIPMQPVAQVSNSFDTQTGQPIPTVAQGSRFDPQTGQPIPKFDPLTGQQNWFE